MFRVITKQVSAPHGEALRDPRDRWHDFCRDRMQQRENNKPYGYNDLRIVTPKRDAATKDCVCRKAPNQEQQKHEHAAAMRCADHRRHDFCRDRNQQPRKPETA
jgi:hypothetical protein